MSGEQEAGHPGRTAHGLGCLLPVSRFNPWLRHGRRALCSGTGGGARRPPWLLYAGDSLPMDVSSVHHNSTLLRYSVSLLGYGFYGDIIKDSEQKRWMGLVRYDFSGNSEYHAGSFHTRPPPRSGWGPIHRRKPGGGSLTGPGCPENHCRRSQASPHMCSELEQRGMEVDPRSYKQVTVCTSGHVQHHPSAFKCI